MKNKKINSEILNDIYQNAHIALQSISNLSPEIEENAVKKHILDEYDAYKNFINKLSNYMESNNVKPKDINVFKKTSMVLAIKMKTLTGTDSNKIADMMIKGAVNGTNELIAIRNGGKMNGETLEFLDELLSVEQKSIDGWQKFL